MSKIKDFLRNAQRWSSITVLYKRRLRVLLSENGFCFTVNDFISDQSRYCKLFVKFLLNLIWCFKWIFLTFLYHFPSRIGMILTLYLISADIYNFVKGPKSLGFSYIEVWMIGTQIPILIVLLEYGYILFLKKSAGKWKTKRRRWIWKHKSKNWMPKSRNWILQQWRSTGSLLEGKAEISVIFGWDFGRNDDLINSFWI